MHRTVPTSQRASREKGGISVVAVLVCLILTVLAVGGASVGRIAAARADLQRAVDGASLAAAQIIRERGLPFDAAARTSAETVARRNTPHPIAFNWNVTETPTAVRFTVTATATMPAFRLIHPSGSVNVTADASGEATQQTFTDAERRLPKLTLVLDYSGSMSQIMPGSGGLNGTAMLEANVFGLLAAGYPIDYGAVFFSGSSFRTIAINAAAPALIRAAMAVDGPGGGTCTHCGINSARNIILAAPDTGRYMLVVSDGQPNSVPAAQSAAAVARAAGITIITLHIDWSGGSGTSLRNFMISISGPPGAAGDPSFYYRADTADSLRDTFGSIVASIICSIGPLSPVPTDPASMRVYLRNPAGNETLVPAVADLSADPTIIAYRYDVASATIRMTQASCDAILDGGERVVLRYGNPTLVD